MIRLATLSDIPQIMALIKITIKKLNEEDIPQWDEIYPTEKTIQEDIERKSLFKYEIDGRLACIIVLNEDQHELYKTISWEDRTGRPLVVHRLCVHPDFQRQGLAKKMMQFTEEYARENSFSSIRLEAFVPNAAACKLYENIAYIFRGKALFRRGWFNCYEKSVL